MGTRIIVARHGNTFKKGEIPTRVGKNTDLPLVEELKASNVAELLLKRNLIPSFVYAAPLLRTTQTAELIIKRLNLDTKVISLDDFTEIDYGPDENKIEEEVMLRLGDGNIEKGKQIIDDWNKLGNVPSGWNVDPLVIIDAWFNFAEEIEQEHQNNTVLLVSSNGIIRFSPYLTGDFRLFTKNHNLKVSTGGVCIFEKELEDENWKCSAWNETI